MEIIVACVLFLIGAFGGSQLRKKEIARLTHQLEVSKLDGLKLRQQYTSNLKKIANEILVYLKQQEQRALEDKYQDLSDRLKGVGEDVHK